jgi:hypothetical protein
MKKLYTVLLVNTVFALTSFSQSIVSVSPATIPSSGSVTITLIGYHTFFTLHSGYSARLTQPELAPSSTFISVSTNVIDDTHLQATFNILNPVHGGYYRVSLTAGGGYLINWLNNGIFMTGVQEKRLLNINPNYGIAGTTLTAQITGAGARFMTSTGANTINYIQITNENGPPTTPINAAVITPIDSDHVDVSFNIPSTAINSTYKITMDQASYALGQTYKSGFLQVINGVDKGIVSVTPNVSYKGDSVYMIVEVTGTNLTSSPLTYSQIRLTGETNTYSLSVGSTSVSTIDATHALIKWRLGIFAPEGEYYLQLYNSNLGFFYKHFTFRIKPPKVIGFIYEDLNQNGVFDGTDYGIGDKKVLLLPDSVYGFTDENGFYAFSPDSGTYSIKYVQDSSWILTSTPSIYSGIQVSDTTLTGFNFGIHDTLYDYKHDFVVNTHPVRCNANNNYSTWTIHNNTPYSHTGRVTHIHSANLPVNYTQIAPDSVNGNILYWNYVVAANSTISCDVRYTGPPANNTVGYSYTDQVFDGLGNIVVQYHDTFSTVVTCSYDPNDKSVMPLENIQHPYTLPTSDLDYTIRFQNTGNDTAFLVVIKDTLSGFLDLNTFQVISSSHPVQTTLSVPDRIATFTFDNILLPDSIIDEPGSHGFVKFRIHLVNNIPDSTTIYNNAAIYFDFNDPVITNSTINHLVYPFQPVAGLSASDSIVCVGECIQFANNSDSSTSWQWYFPSSTIDSTDLQTPADVCYPDTGLYDVILVATNAFSSDTLWLNDFIHVVANPPSPFITQISDTLFCSSNPAYVAYQWYYNGQPITGATNSWYVINDTGSFSVMVYDINGCSSDATVNITVGLSSIIDFGFKVYPNPASDKLYIRRASGEIGRVILTDISGRIIQDKLINNEITVLDICDISGGVFILKIEGPDNKQRNYRILKN